MVVTHDEELLHAFANRLMFLIKGEMLSFEALIKTFRNYWLESEKKEAWSSLPLARQEKRNVCFK